eukprot:10869393-Karenia_brevis.AAC.1
MDEQVIENRHLFLSYAVETKQLVMNTFFEKAEVKKATYKEKKSHAGGPPWRRPVYEVLDYVLTPRRWRNSIKDAESDTHVNISSDHFPIWIRTVVNLKAKPQGARRTRPKFLQCTEEERKRFNQSLQAALPEER